MAAPANNPFGAPPAQALNNPFGAPASGQPTPVFGKQTMTNPFGAPAQNRSSTPTAKSSVHNPFLAPISGNRSSSAAPTNNPFSAPISGSRPSSAGNPFGAPSSQTSVFGTPTASRQPSPSIPNHPSGNPPSQAKSANFSAAAGQGANGVGSTSSPFGQAKSAGTPDRPSALGVAGTNTMPRWGKPAGGKSAVTNNGGGFGGRAQNKDPQRANPFGGPKQMGKQPNGQVPEATKRSKPGARNKKPERTERHQSAPSAKRDQKGTLQEPNEKTKQLSPFAFNFANKLFSQLKQENINPPQWPAQPGDPSKRGAIEGLKDAYKKYRTRVYASLRKAELIDDPEKRRRLEDALPFKGTCEDMCPEFEKICRIAEYDVKTEEKETGPDGLTMWPNPSRMVKKFGRSAAGQDAPLPMDVRSVGALRRTTDYLFNDLLQSESNLPSMHNFLWDRTRAVRKDFTFHSQKSAEEMKEMVYCFETITRFHATALHLLSKKGFANEDFDQKQEIEQLGRTILSLIEAYDVCRDKRVTCENEPEFRAYYLLLNAHDPSIAKRIPTWGKEYWFESEEVQTALSLVQAMDDVREPKGPIKPRRPTTLSDTSFTNYFSIVEDPRVSYTMACIAEVHFTTVRQGVLRNLVRSYARHRDAPRTITASDLNRMLRFDSDEEAVEFVELHDFEFSTWVPEGKNPVTEPYLLLNSRRKHVPSPRVRQSFSGKLVERKRTTQSLPYVIYNTIFEEPAENPPSSEDSPDQLFVNQTAPSEFALPATSSTTVQPVAPSLPTNPFAFGSAAKGAPLPNGIPSTEGLSGAPGQTLSCILGSQPASSANSALPNPFCGSNVPTASFFGVGLAAPQAQAGQSSTPDTASTKSPFSGLAQPTQTTGPAFAAPKPSEASNPFSFHKDSTPALAPPASIFTSAPSSAPSSTTQDAASTTKPLWPTSAPGPAPPALPAPQGAAFLPPTTSGKPTGAQPASAAPGIPNTSIAAPPPTVDKPTPSATQPAIFRQPHLPASSKSQTPAVPPTPLPPPPKRDLMGDFTKWFVKGDEGVMEQFTENTLQDMLWEVFAAFQREQEERKRKEEDEESWRLAREHQAYRLQVKYFYRWRDTARSLATKRILREGKERMRLYREEKRLMQRQQQEEKEKAEREARRAAKRRLLEDGKKLSLLAAEASAGRRSSIAYSTNHDHHSPEDHEQLLLANGILSGLRDEMGHIRRIGGEDGWAGSASPARSFRYSESELEFEPPPPRSTGSPADDVSSVGRREGWKTRSLREKFGIVDHQSSMSRSRGRSISASGSIINGSSSRFLRQSLPAPASRTTNFASSSRKRSAEASSDGGESDTKKHRYPLYNSNNNTPTKTGLARSRHWDLRARGLVPMPDGNWLPEAMLARDLASTTPGIHSDDGDDEEHGGSLHHINDDSRWAPPASPATAAAEATTSNMQLRLARLKRAGLRAHTARSGGSVDLLVSGHGHGRGSAGPNIGMDGFLRAGSPPGIKGPSSSSSVAGKRKRGMLVDGDGSGDGIGDGDGEDDGELSPPEAKKKAAGVVSSGVGAGVGVSLGREETSAMVENTRKMLRELREFMDQADRDGAA
ncbi:SAC3 family protein 1 [Madurella mycetomatis]|uniref:SAC3 family protein 1 n=1 Tax=Madurella mycetomatis TaxID=100816 RepID=A0A175WIC3_9PEZI|nr:SAC3 family protein 1 [Madurella mycetomatis]